MHGGVFRIQADHFADSPGRKGLAGILGQRDFHRHFVAGTKRYLSVQLGQYAGATDVNGRAAHRFTAMTSNYYFCAAGKPWRSPPLRVSEFDTLFFLMRCDGGILAALDHVTCVSCNYIGGFGRSITFASQPADRNVWRFLS